MKVVFLQYYFIFFFNFLLYLDKINDIGYVLLARTKYWLSIISHIEYASIMQMSNYRVNKLFVDISSLNFERQWNPGN